MSGQYKGGLSAGGLSFTDKAKLQMRRPTPDSDAVASSDDEHASTLPRPGAYPTGRRPSTGWLQDIQPNRKFSLPSVSLAGSQPTTPSVELPHSHRQPTSGFQWNVNSFGSQGGTRLKEVLPSPTTIQPSVDRPIPSPTQFEAEDGIGFLLNNSPVRKQVRSQSYSVGQADLESGQYPRMRSSLRHRPSKPSLLGDNIGQLGQVREDDLDDIESSNGSQQGVPLPADYWEREGNKSLLKHMAKSNTRSPYRLSASPSGRRRSVAPRSSTEAVIDALEDLDLDADQGPNHMAALTRRYSENATSGGLGDHFGRRHSFATYTTNSAALHLATLPDHDEVDEDLVSPLGGRQEEFSAFAYFQGSGPATRMANASAVSIAHPDPVVPRSEPTPHHQYTIPPVVGRPGRRLFVVVFKCQRADIYYTYDNTGLEIHCGDLVITEGDRGCDLGQVSHADVTLEEAKKYKAEASDEHYRWLVMFSQYSLAGAADNRMLGSLARSTGYPNQTANALHNPGTIQDQETKPKMIKRLAQSHEVIALRDKEGSEAKAKRLGALKAAEHKLPMEILDAEYQADYHKLTYFYYAESYVNFNDLVTDLFKQYKVRIWMSAVNPASVVNPAGGPSAIGPGAILNRGGPNAPSVGGFGSGGFRGNDRHHSGGRGAGNSNMGRGGFNGGGGGGNTGPGGYYPFANQVPNYDLSRYPVYLNATPNPEQRVSPFNNYGAYVPPTTYSTPPQPNPTSSNTGHNQQGDGGAGRSQPGYESNMYVPKGSLPWW